MTMHIKLVGMPREPRYNPARDLAHTYRHVLRDAEEASYSYRDFMAFECQFEEVSDDDLFAAWEIVAAYFADVERLTREHAKTVPVLMIREAIDRSGWMSVRPAIRAIICGAIGKEMFARMPLYVADLAGFSEHIGAHTVEEIRRDAEAVKRAWTWNWCRHRAKRVGAWLYRRTLGWCAARSGN